MVKETLVDMVDNVGIGEVTCHSLIEAAIRKDVLVEDIGKAAVASI